MRYNKTRGFGACDEGPVGFRSQTKAPNGIITRLQYNMLAHDFDQAGEVLTTRVTSETKVTFIRTSSWLCKMGCGGESNENEVVREEKRRGIGTFNYISTSSHFTFTLLHV
jgi:hypothetical protein